MLESDYNFVFTRENFEGQLQTAIDGLVITDLGTPNEFLPIFKDIANSSSASRPALVEAARAKFEEFYEKYGDRPFVVLDKEFPKFKTAEDLKTYLKSQEQKKEED